MDIVMKSKRRDEYGSDRDGGMCRKVYVFFFFFFKQKTAYEMCGRDWSSDVCSSDLICCQQRVKRVTANGN